MLENFDVIAIFTVYDQSGAVWKPDSGHIVCKTYIQLKRFILQKLKTELTNL